MALSIGKKDYYKKFSKSYNYQSINLSDKELERYKSALESAMDIRKFEIDLYWKRSQYFWAFISGAYILYFYVVKEIRNEQIDILKLTATLKNANIINEPEVHQQLDMLQSADVTWIPFIISAIIVFISINWYLVNKGSKFWQNNWERQVDLLEDIVHGPLYKTIIFEKTKRLSIFKPYPYSVSKLNQLLSLFVATISIVLFFKELVGLFFPKINFDLYIIVFIGAVIFVSSVYMVIKCYSELNGIFKKDNKLSKDDIVIIQRSIDVKK